MTSFVSLTRRGLLAAATATAVLPTLLKPVSAESRKLRIGVQKYGTLIVLQVSGALEKRAGAEERLDRMDASFPPVRNCLRR